MAILLSKYDVFLIYDKSRANLRLFDIVSTFFKILFKGDNINIFINNGMHIILQEMKIHFFFFQNLFLPIRRM